MKTDDLKAQGLTDEQIAFVMKENGTDLKALQDENATLKTEKSQLENDKQVLEKEKGEKEQALKNLQEKSITKEEYDNWYCSIYGTTVQKTDEEAEFESLVGTFIPDVEFQE